MSRLAPLPLDAHPELAEAWAAFGRTLGFVPNSQLILQRRPKVVQAMGHLATAIFDPDGEVPLGFRRLVGFLASRTHGCQYCMAHGAGAALRLAVDPAKLDAIWSYATSPLYTEAERAALDFTVAAASQPNAVDDAMMAHMRAHWTEDQIVEIAAVVAYFGFMNRWNDTMATPLEDEPVEVATRHLAGHGWEVGKHRR